MAERAEGSIEWESRSIHHIITPARVIYANVMVEDELHGVLTEYAIERHEVMAWGLIYYYDKERLTSENMVVGLIALPGYEELVGIDEYAPDVGDRKHWISYGDPAKIIIGGPAGPDPVPPGEVIE